MNQPSPESQSGPPPNTHLPELIQQADQALKGQVWEAAIQAYRSVLKHDPSHALAELGLGRSYEGKSRDAGSQAFLLLAIDHYRRGCRLDPRLPEAHDALLAAALKAGQLEDLLVEYKTLAARDPANALFAVTLKKIQTYLMMVTNRQQAGTRQRPFLRFLCGIAAPILALFSFSCWLVFRWQESSPLLNALSPVFYRIGLLSLCTYLAFKFFSRR